MRIILILVFVSLGFITKAQQLQNLGSANTRVIAKGQLQIDSLFVLPNKDTLFTPYKAGAILFAYGSMYMHTGTKWVQLIDNQKQPWLDSAYVVNDSTVRIRRNGLTSDLVVKGGIRPPTPLLGTATNDSTLTLTYNGSPIVVPIKGATNRINAKVDSVTKSNDSVYSWKAGVKSFSFLVPSTAASTTTASNQGTGAPVFKQKIGDELQFRSIVPYDSKITVTQNANDITLRVKDFTDSIYRKSASDSVFFMKNGVAVFAFKDSAAAAAPAANVFSSTPLVKTVDTIGLSYSSDGLYIDGSSLSAKAKVVKNFTEMRLAQPDTSLIYIFRRGDNEFRYRYDPSDVTSNDDSATVFRNGSWRFKAIVDDVVYPEMWGAVGDGTTNDAASFNAMYRWMEANNKNVKTVKHKHTTYLINDTIYLPYSLNSSTFVRLKIDGTGVTYQTTAAIPVLYRIPTDQSSANNIISNYTIEIENLKIKGNSTTGQMGMKLGAYYTPIFKGMHFEQLDTAVVALFWLNGRFTANHLTLNRSIGFLGASGSGYWSGATVSNSAFNINTLEGNRIFNYGGSYAGVYLIAADGLLMKSHISEGQNPRFDIYDDSQAATVVNGNKFENIWFESTGGVYAKNVCFYIRNNGTTTIDGLQNDYADTLLQIRNPVSSSHMIIRNIQYYNIGGKILDADGASYGGRTMDVGDGANAFSKIFTDTTYWVGGVIPFDITARNGNEIKTTNTNLYLRPFSNASALNRVLYLSGRIAFETDNTYAIGASQTANFRPNSVTVGTGGIRVDKSASVGYAFGDITATPTEYISWGGAGRIRFNGTGAIDFLKGTTAQRPAGTFGSWLRYNTDSTWFEGHNGTSWFRLATAQAVRDSAAQIRAAIPAQLNATAGTNMTITGTYPNLTFNATGGGGTSSESLAVINDVDYTIATATGNLSVVFSNVTATRNLTIPAASGNTGRIIRVRHSGGPFLINLSTAIKINTSTSIVGISQDSEITFMSDGTDWWIVTMH